MGRNTYESIPIQWRPLTNRLNIVLTNNKQLHIKCDNLIYTDEAGMWDVINSYKTIYSKEEDCHYLFEYYEKKI